MAFLIESKVKDFAQEAPISSIALGEVLNEFVLTATILFFSSEAFSISHVTQSLKYVFFPTIHRK